MHWKRKVSIGALFGLGWVCIAVSTVRVTYLGNNSSGEFKQPSTSWLALWGVVESGIGKSNLHNSMGVDCCAQHKTD